MESKALKGLLAAILVSLIILAVPVWGMFLRGESADITGYTTTPGKTDSVTEQSNSPEQSDSNKTEPTATATENVFNPLPVTSDEWILAPLILFKDPQSVKVETRRNGIISMTVKVPEGLEIRKPFDDSWFTVVEDENGPGFFFSKDLESAEKGIGLKVIATGGDIEFLYKEDDKALVNGVVIGICKYSGEMEITMHGIDVEAVDPTEWLNEALKAATGSEGNGR